MKLHGRLILYMRLKNTLQPQDARDWATLQVVGERNADQDPDEVLADVTEEVEAVRREMAAERRVG